MSLPELALVCALTFLGTLVQGSVGFGLALLVVPALLLTHPSAVPGTVLFLALPMVVVMALRERRAIDVPGFWRLTLGRAPGTAVGVWLVGAFGSGATAGVVGAMLLGAVLLSFARAAIRATPRTQLVAGFASGVMSTVGAVGGAPMGLAYQDRPGPEVRATLALAFLVGLLMSLAALGAAGEVRAEHLVLALELLPALALGLLASAPAARWLDGPWLRPAVLGFAGAAGAFALGQALLARV